MLIIETWDLVKSVPNPCPPPPPHPIHTVFRGKQAAGKGREITINVLSHITIQLLDGVRN